jgi:hypothetical protein
LILECAEAPFAQDFVIEIPLSTLPSIDTTSDCLKTSVTFVKEHFGK